jgi:hypothetical protein
MQEGTPDLLLGTSDSGIHVGDLSVFWFQLFYFGLAVVGFELRASDLLGRCSTT